MLLRESHFRNLGSTEEEKKRENIVYSDTPVCVIHSGIFGTSGD